MQLTGRSLLLVLLAVVVCLGAGLGGEFIARRLSPSNSITYSDFISIMLSAISLLLTLLAFILAIFGFVGWTAINAKVSNDAKTFLTSGFVEGNALHTLVKDEVLKINREMYNGVLGIDREFDADVKAEDQAGEDI